MTKNVLLVGVGGQGILSASDILGVTAVRSGYDVKKNEVHGMSQRGGSVFSHVRWGEKIYAPVIPEGEADIIIAFEKMEALRWIRFANSKTLFLVNTMEIPPVSVSRSEILYPENIEQRLKAVSDNVEMIEAQKIAENAGHVKAANTVMIGAVAAKLNFPQKIWEDVITEKFHKKNLGLNLKAFREMYNGAEK